MVGEHGSAGSVRKERRSVPGVVFALLQEKLSKWQHVGESFAKGWDTQFDDAQTEVKVRTKSPFLDGLFEVSIRRRYDTDIGPYRLVATEPFKGMTLEDSEEFGLDFHTHLPEFIQEHRAGVGQFELADFSIGRTGEGTFFVPEEFAFQERRRKGRAVDRDKRP